MYNQSTLLSDQKTPVLCWRCKGKKEYKNIWDKLIKCPECNGLGKITTIEKIQKYFDDIKGMDTRSTDTKTRLTILPTKKFTCESCTHVYAEVLLHHPMFLHNDITGREDIYPCDVQVVSKRYAHDEICIFCLEGNPPQLSNDINIQIQNVERYFKSQSDDFNLAIKIINHQKRGVI